MFNLYFQFHSYRLDYSIDFLAKTLAFESCPKFIEWMIKNPMNQSRLSKLLRFNSSASKNTTSLEEYISRMKPTQSHIYWMAGENRNEVENSQFVKQSLAHGYEILYVIRTVKTDEYLFSLLPEFNGKKFQNIAEEGLNSYQGMTKKFEPLTKWMNDVALKGQITKAITSERLRKSPCALVANVFRPTGMYSNTFKNGNLWVLNCQANDNDFIVLKNKNEMYFYGGQLTIAVKICFIFYFNTMILPMHQTKNIFFWIKKQET